MNKLTQSMLIVLWIFFIGSLGSVSLACPCHQPGNEIRNLSFIKQDLIEYHDSGNYHKEQAAVMKAAKEYLQCRLVAPHKKPLAVVLDIDETSLSNYPDMLKMDFGGTMQQINAAEAAGHDPAIQPTLDFYRFAKVHGVSVFFVTARRERYRTATAANLVKVGYKNWDGLTLVSNGYHQSSVAPYKTQARRAIEEKGYEIALNIGDQQSDLVGGYATKTFKMPNPYYIVP